MIVCYFPHPLEEKEAAHIHKAVSTYDPELYCVRGEIELPNRPGFIGSSEGRIDDWRKTEIRRIAINASEEWKTLNRRSRQTFEIGVKALEITLNAKPVIELAKKALVEKTTDDLEVLAYLIAKNLISGARRGITNYTLAELKMALAHGIEVRP